jgi:hypothetical protein
LGIDRGFVIEGKDHGHDSADRADALPVHESLDLRFAFTQDIPAITQLLQYFSGLVLVEQLEPNDLIKRSTNIAVEKIRVLKGNKLGNPLDAPP